MPSDFYEKLREKRSDNDELAACVERVVTQLELASTSGDRPGMLLGKIQSGKTRGFVGVIAQAFDRGFDIALVLTKGTKTLSAQTVARLGSDFSDFIENDRLLVLDIMKLPGNLTKSELRRKIVLVAKKQTQDLSRLIEFLKGNPGLKNRRVLLVDDEADLAGLRFVRKHGEEAIDQGTIAEQIDELRRMTKGIAFLQVTATPYSLYLQPEGYEDANTNGNYVFKPKRPAFTELLPIHGGYVGGNDYFGDFEDDNPRAYLISLVTPEEQDALRRQDRRRISPDRVLEMSTTQGIRRAIITFVLAVCVRRWQQHELKERRLKYSMIIHNDTQKQAHAWQDQVIDWIFDAILNFAESEPQNLRPLFDAAFDDLNNSVQADLGRMPPRDVVFDLFIDSFKDGEIVREKVNSDRDVMALLDEKAELRLRTPFNIFVGGNILDRGITIPNLISFYYGRNPKTMQADTVLQHSRMYGNRNRHDLAVTRFYTSKGVYDRLYTINKLENALRQAFEKGAHDNGVVFIEADASGHVRPCAPNKISLSNVVTVQPNGLLLPTGFRTRSGNSMKAAQAKLNSIIIPSWRNTESFISIDQTIALSIIDAIKDSIEDDDFEWNAMKGLLNYYLKTLTPGDTRELLLLAVTGRRLSREKSGDKSGLSILGTSLRKIVLAETRVKPALILLEQEGSRELGWSGHAFWWPILAAPATVEPCVFAVEVASV